jgi:DNA repair protein RecO (recombination protein O)
MRFTSPAIMVSLRAHGEHGAVVRLLTPQHGLQAAYVRGARGRRMRPVLVAGNLVEANLAARTEGQPYPRLYLALDGLLGAIEAAPAASGWGAAMVRYELLLLAELGFGLDLDRCAVSGDVDDLIAVSPRSGRAVSAAEAEPYLGKLLALPRFVREGGQAGWDDIIDGLALSGHFLMRDLITDRAAPVAAARERLIERLRRAAGVA